VIEPAPGPIGYSPSAYSISGTIASRAWEAGDPLEVELRRAAHRTNSPPGPSLNARRLTPANSGARDLWR
jgi:hypothetical protein